MQIANAFGAEIGFELVALMMVVQRFDALLKAYGDEETDDDGGDVSEKLAPVAAAWCGGWTSIIGASGSCGKPDSGEGAGASVAGACDGSCI